MPAQIVIPKLMATALKYLDSYNDRTAVLLFCSQALLNQDCYPGFPHLQWQYSAPCDAWNFEGTRLSNVRIVGKHGVTAANATHMGKHPKGDFVTDEMTVVFAVCQCTKANYSNR